MLVVSGVGRLTRDPEVTEVGEHRKATFGVAIDRAGDKGAAGFFRVEAWNSSADFVEKYFSKGKPIFIAGELAHSTWTDEGTNSKRESVYIKATRIAFVPGVPKADDGEGGGDEEATPTTVAVSVKAEVEDLIA